MTPTAGPITLVLIDDHEAVRHGLRLVLEAEADLEVVGEAGDGASGIELVVQLQPTIALVDVSMPKMSGLVATKLLRERAASTEVVVLTRHDDQAYLHELLRAGAAGYVLKQSAAAELVRAIRTVASGRRYLDPTLAAGVTAGFVGRLSAGSSKPSASLSDREGEVLRLIAAGYSNKEIAGRLELSVKTVEVHKANAMRKMGFAGRIDIVRYAVLQGWLDDP